MNLCENLEGISMGEEIITIH